MKKTRKAYEQHLNECSPAQDSDEWIIGGAMRTKHMWKDQYGTAIRKYDPIGFEVGFKEWSRS